MADLATLANYAEILGAATVVGGVVFALVQLRHFRRQRLDLAAIDLVHSAQNPEFLRAARVVVELSEVATVEAIERDAEVRQAINQVGYALGNMGVLVFHRVVPLRIVDDIVGGLTRLAWAKVKPYAEYRRRKLGTPHALEWFQWLAERLEHSSGDREVGAHVAHRDWRP